MKVMGTGSWFMHEEYCRFGNFLVIFISQIFHLGNIHEFLNLRASIRLTKIAIYRLVFTISARTFNSRGNKFSNISENKVLANISESTVSQGKLLCKVSYSQLSLL